MLDIESYLALRERPNRHAAMYQRWHDLTFLHFSLEPELVQKTLPAGLTVDTFPNAEGEERAWIGLVPFHMSGIRFVGTPAVPGCSAFHETNVRTYVHREGKEPGVWFFSLDAANPVACAYARRCFGLAYHYAAMRFRRQGDLVRFSSARDGDVSIVGQTKVGIELELPKPGSLSFFLIERYLLYAVRRGRLCTGRVHHKPYGLRSAEYTGFDHLVAAAGLPDRPWEHVVFSPGVDVEVFSLQRA